MATKPQTEMVKVQALAAFCGSYPCSLIEASHYVDEVDEDTVTGTLTKKRVARKRFFGAVSVERYATATEIEAALAGNPPPGVEFLTPLPKSAVTPNGQIVPIRVLERADPVVLPRPVAEDLAARGLATIIGGA